MDSSDWEDVAELVEGGKRISRVTGRPVRRKPGNFVRFLLGRFADKYPKRRIPADETDTGLVQYHPQYNPPFDPAKVKPENRSEFLELMLQASEGLKPNKPFDPVAEQVKARKEGRPIPYTKPKAKKAPKEEEKKELPKPPVRRFKKKAVAKEEAKKEEPKKEVAKPLSISSFLTKPPAKKEEKKEEAQTSNVMFDRNVTDFVKENKDVFKALKGHVDMYKNPSANKDVVQAYRRRAKASLQEILDAAKEAKIANTDIDHFLNLLDISPAERKYINGARLQDINLG